MPYCRSVFTLLAITACSLLIAQSFTYSYDSAGRLASVRYPSGKTIQYQYDRSGNRIRELIVTPVPGIAPVISAAGVVNAASFLGGAVAPGEIVTIFGAGMGPSALAGLQVDSRGFVANYIAESSVYFDEVPSPLIYVSASQLSAIVPYAVAGRSSTQLIVEYQGRRSNTVTLNVTAAAPALFSLNSSGKGNGAILNQDSSVNGPSNPADKGSIVVLYGTGEGQTLPAGADGRLAASVFPKPIANTTVTIGGRPAELLYAGAAPGLVAGVFQINARIPDTAPSGDVAVVVQVGGVSSQSDLTVRVR